MNGLISWFYPTRSSLNKDVAKGGPPPIECYLAVLSPGLHLAYTHRRKVE